MLLVPRDIYRRKSRVRRDSCEFPARHQFICNNRCQRLHDYINHTCHDKNQSIPHTSRHLLLPSDMNYKEFHDVPSTTPKNGWESRQGVEKADDRGLPAMMMGTPMWTTRAPFTLCPEKKTGLVPSKCNSIDVTAMVQLRLAGQCLHQSFLSWSDSELVEKWWNIFIHGLSIQLGACL